MRYHPITRRRFLQIASMGGAALWGASCAPSPAPAPTAPPAKPAAPAPTVAPTPVPKPSFKEVTFPFAGAVSIPANVSWGVGKEQGYFKEFGIDLKVTYIRGTAGLIPALVNEEGWLGWLATAGVLNSIEKGSNLRFVGGAYTVPSFVFFGRKGIKSMADLEGKAIGSDQPGSLTYDLTQLALKEAGLIGKVQQVTIGATPDIVRALIAGKIDAGLGTVTFIPMAEKEGLVTLVKLWERFPKYMSAGFISTVGSIQKHRDEIVRALAGFVKTYRYVLQDSASKATWVKVATTEFKEEASDAELEWQWYRDNKGFSLDLALGKEQIDFMQQLNIEGKSQTKVLPFEQVADMSLLKDALALVKG